MSTSAPVRVMIVDDHSMVRRGLSAILRVKAGLELVAEASNGREALQLCQQAQPDVILMDLVMPEMDGAAATQAIRAHHPQIQVIALTSFKEKELVQAALNAGAIGYLLKNVSADELAEAIQAAHAGRPTFAPEVVQVLSQAEKLEHLARAIVDAVPEEAALPALLEEHVPGMLEGCTVQICIFPEETLLWHPSGDSAAPHAVWNWLRTIVDAQSFLPGSTLPWGGTQPADQGLVLAPISTAESPEPVGGIYVARRRDPGAVADLLPTVKSLAAQISSALQSARIQAQTEAHQKIARELAMAGQIQASFLPRSVPNLPGWQLAVTLEPANETSGDFYDFIPLPDRRWGLVIADVSDKGLGAALYMALSRTLLRTYAAEHPTRPDLVLSATSRRILSDARAGLFVTVFYGILDPDTGLLTYCNAGHTPPYLVNPPRGGSIEVLAKTGMALGAVEDTAWRQNTVRLEPGGLLLLCTDGITEAQNTLGEMFGRERLAAFLHNWTAGLERPGRSAQETQAALLTAVRQFSGEAAQSDDMTLMVLVRDA
jgi:serine phosphatase RsbU (regulator of sigma subunit)/DNA-binding NarL/FixJ family response regulator